MAETIVATPRLALRGWDERDAPALDAALNRPAVTRWLAGPADHVAMAARAAAARAAEGLGLWLVERRADGAVLGLCGLVRTQRAGAPVDGAVEAAWRLREDAWGMGYGREAAEATLGHGFSTHRLDRILAYTVRRNGRSWGLMQRLGMVRAPALDHPVAGVAPDITDHIVYEIERGDWTQ